VDRRLLFRGQDIYDFVEVQRAKLKSTYEALPDNQALDEAFALGLKSRFMLDIPRLKPNEWTSEQRAITPHSIEIVAYIPFEGDPAVFNIKPSASKMTLAQGEIVDHDLLIRLQPTNPEFDVAGYVKREVGEVEWRLESLRGSMEYMNQQLEATIRGCIAQRKRSVDNRAKISQNVGIPQRKAPVAAVKPAAAPVPAPISKVPTAAKAVQEQWDIFMSHASPDKLWVRGLVNALRAQGVTVWFDEDTLEWGGDLQRSINRGLANSRKAIAVLSEAYLAERKWTEAEISGLLTREKLGETLVLPIWHKVTEDDLKRYNLVLASRVAKFSDSDSYDEIVRAVLKALGRSHEVVQTDNTQVASPARPQDEFVGPLDPHGYFFYKDRPDKPLCPKCLQSQPSNPVFLSPLQGTNGRYRECYQDHCQWRHYEIPQTNREEESYNPLTYGLRTAK